MHKSRLIKKKNKKILLGVAHRGLHNKEITENSLGAFKNAIDHDFAFAPVVQKACQKAETAAARV